MNSLRETRLVIFSEDYGTSVLCITNLDNKSLYELLVQFEEDMENGVGRPLSEIVDEWVDYRPHFDIDSFLKELGCAYDNEFEDINDLDCMPLVNYSCYNFSVVNGKI